MNNADGSGGSDLQDTAISPVKDKDIDLPASENNFSGAKRGLEFNQEKDDLTQPPIGSVVGDPHAMAMDIVPVPPPAVGAVIDKDIKKRSKKDGTNSNNSIGSANSSKGSVRSQ
jgi:DNA-directed RNA polymerase beta' subunit